MAVVGPGSTTGVQQPIWQPPPQQAQSRILIGDAAALNIINQALNPRGSHYVSNTLVGFANDRWPSATSFSNVTSASDGPPDLSGSIASYARGTVTGTQTALGFHLADNPEAGAGSSSPLVLSPGGVYTAAVWIRCSATADFVLQVAPANGSNTQLTPAQVTVTCSAGTWTRIAVTFTAQSTAVKGSAYVVATTALPIGATFDGTGLMVINAADPGDHLDGSVAGWSWSGTVDNSTSSGPYLVFASTTGGGITLAGSGTAQAQLTASGALSLGGSGSASAQPTAAASITLAGTGTAGAAAAATGGVSLAGTGVASGPAAATGAITLSGLATVTAAASGAITIGGAGAAEATATATGLVTLTGTATPTATGSGQIALSGTAAAGAQVAASGSISLTGTGAGRAQVTAAGTVTLGGTATVTQPGSSAAGSITLAGTASATATATAAGTVTLGGTATPAIVATAAGSVTLAGAGAAAVTASSSGTLTLAGAAQLSALANAAGAISITGLATGTGGTGPILHAGPGETLTVTREKRLGVVIRETRTITVVRENRTHRVVADSRLERIPAEDRTVRR